MVNETIKEWLDTINIKPVVIAGHVIVELNDVRDWIGFDRIMDECYALYPVPAKITYDITDIKCPELLPLKDEIVEQYQWLKQFNHPRFAKWTTEDKLRCIVAIYVSDFIVKIRKLMYISNIEIPKVIYEVRNPRNVGELRPARYRSLLGAMYEINVSEEEFKQSMFYLDGLARAFKIVRIENGIEIEVYRSQKSTSETEII